MSLNGPFCAAVGVKLIQDSLLSLVARYTVDEKSLSREATSSSKPRTAVQQPKQRKIFYQKTPLRLFVVTGLPFFSVGLLPETFVCLLPSFFLVQLQANISEQVLNQPTCLSDCFNLQTTSHKSIKTLPRIRKNASKAIFMTEIAATE